MGTAEDIAHSLTQVRLREREGGERMEGCGGGEVVKSLDDEMHVKTHQLFHFSSCLPSIPLFEIYPGWAGQRIPSGFWRCSRLWCL